MEQDFAGGEGSLAWPSELPSCSTDTHEFLRVPFLSHKDKMGAPGPTLSQERGAHAFNSRTPEAEAGRTLRSWWPA